MKVTIAKVSEVIFDGEAESLTVPGSAGEMTVLSHHEPFITTLKEGTIHLRLTKEGAPQTFQVTQGVLEVSPSGATVIL